MKYQIALVYGGASVEHEVSILTALYVMKYIDLEQFEVTLVYYDKHQHFYIGEVLSDLSFYSQMDYSKLCEVTFVYKNFLTYLKPKVWLKKAIQIDMALPLVHGHSGEDGTLQGLFETMQLPYGQSSLVSCAMGLDKEMTKKWLQFHQLPVLPSHVFYRDEVVSDSTCLNNCSLPFPWILKPARGGSSIGIQWSEPDTLLRKTLECFSFDHKLLVETKLSSYKEFNIAVLGDQENQICSQIEEVIKKDEILSYQDKYEQYQHEKKANHIIPALIDQALEQQIITYATRAFQVFDCSGVVRIDFLYHENQLYINEINMIPGSLALYLFDGIDKKEVMNTILLLGFKRFRQKMREIHTFDSSLLLKQNNFNFLKGEIT